MTEIRLDRVYVPSDDIVAREIEGELIIIPLTTGMGNLEDELYTLNETGKAIWKRLDGRASVRVVVDDLAAEFQAKQGEVERDVCGLMDELLKRRIIVEAAGS